MAAQLTYGYDTPKAVPGLIADLADIEVLSRTNDENDGVLKFGMGVVVGTNVGRSVKKPVAASTAAAFEGVVLSREHTEQDMNGTVVVQKGSVVSVLKRGNVWVRLVEQATQPTYGATAYLVKSGDNAGCFTATSGETTIDVGAKFGAEAQLNAAGTNFDLVRITIG